MTLFRIVETDNFNGDYPDEKFVNLPRLTGPQAKVICDAINASFTGVISSYPRWWKVVEGDYQLQPGFEP